MWLGVLGGGREVDQCLPMKVYMSVGRCMGGVVPGESECRGVRVQGVASSGCSVWLVTGIWRSEFGSKYGVVRNEHDGLISHMNKVYKAWLLECGIRVWLC